MRRTMLTEMERPGFTSMTNPKTGEREAAALQLVALKKAGHAIVADEVTHGDDSVTVSFLHYSSCKRCKDAKV